MRAQTKEALVNLVGGVEGLLDALTAEANLAIDYGKTALKEACRKAKEELGKEKVDE